MTEHKCEIKKVYSGYGRERRSSWWKRLFWPKPSGFRVIGFDYFINGRHAASSMWDGQKIVTVVMPGYDGLFGVAA